jgi:uncharacterized protein
MKFTLKGPFRENVYNLMREIGYHFQGEDKDYNPPTASSRQRRAPKIEKIIHCIETNRFRGNKKLKTKEAKVLFDADKLDAIGAIGIGRAFLFAGEIGAKLHDKNVDIKKTKEYTKNDTAYREYLVKLRKIKDRMFTKEGKRIAKERHKFMVNFFNRLNKEVEGKL